MIDVHDQATAGLTRDRVLVDGSGDGNVLSDEVGRELHGRRERTATRAEQEGRQRQAGQQRQVAIDQRQCRRQAERHRQPNA